MCAFLPAFCLIVAIGTIKSLVAVTIMYFPTADDASGVIATILRPKAECERSDAFYEYTTFSIVVARRKLPTVVSMQVSKDSDVDKYMYISLEREHIQPTWIT